MFSFRECAPAEGVERIASLIPRLTILQDARECAPLARLLAAASAIHAGDTLGALSCYHALSASLLSSGARRVSGDLWLDYLLWLVIERPHAFAVMAADGRMEEAERIAMRADLAILGELATLSGAHLYRMAAERHRELQLKPRHAKDNISLMSSAVWSGGSVRPAPAANAKPQQEPEAPTPFLSSMPPESEWLPWQYGEMELRDAFVSDEALEEVYIRLLETPDWRALCDDLWNFFAAYGCAPFLKDRLFHVKQNALLPLSQHAGRYCALPFLEPERSALTEHAICFMRGETAEPVLLAGPAGTGKTALALSLAEELPELRIVLIPRGTPFDADALIAALAAQPLRFLLLLDDADPASGDVRTLFERRSAFSFPANVLPVVTARAAEPDCGIVKTVWFSYPKLAEFAEMVEALLSQRGSAVDPAAVRNACVDYQVDARERLSVAAAVRLAEELAVGNGYSAVV